MKPCTRCGRDHGRRSGCMIPRAPDADPDGFCQVCGRDITHDLRRREVRWPAYSLDLCATCPVPAWTGKVDLLARPEDDLSVAPRPHAREGYYDMEYNVYR
jgi:hypothetical protein